MHTQTALIRLWFPFLTSLRTSKRLLELGPLSSSVWSDSSLLPVGFDEDCPWPDAVGEEGIMVQARCLGSLKNAESDVTTSDPVRMRSINLVWDLAIRM